MQKPNVLINPKQLFPSKFLLQGILKGWCFVLMWSRNSSERVLHGTRCAVVSQGCNKMLLQIEFEWSECYQGRGGYGFKSSHQHRPYIQVAPSFCSSFSYI